MKKTAFHGWKRLSSVAALQSSTLCQQSLTCVLNIGPIKSLVPPRWTLVELHFDLSLQALGKRSQCCFHFLWKGILSQKNDCSRILSKYYVIKSSEKNQRAPFTASYHLHEPSPKLSARLPLPGSDPGCFDNKNIAFNLQMGNQWLW